MRELVVAIDVGGTRIKGVAVDTQGRVIAQWSRLTDAQVGPDRAVEHILKTGASFLDRARRLQDADVKAIGLAVPGQVDEDAGVGLRSSAIGWVDVPFADLLRRATRVPVVMSHDVRAGARGEAHQGAARDLDSFLFVPIGTGIGAAVMTEHGLLTGANRQAGELGHLRSVGSSERCPCGRLGCVEMVASASSIARHFRTKTRSAEADARVVARLVTEGHPGAQAVWSNAVSALARALDHALALFDPQGVVIGGGLSLAGDTLMRPLADALRELSAPAFELRVAQLGDQAGAVGAAIRTWERL